MSNKSRCPFHQENERHVIRRCRLRSGHGGACDFHPLIVGFAAMDGEKRREIARRGGVASHIHGGGHEFTSDEARIAGKKGGAASAAARRAAL